MSIPQPPWRPHLTAADFTVADLARQGTLVGAWSARWRAAPERALLHDPERGWILRGELDQLTRAVAHQLIGSGIRRGERVLLSGANGLPLVAVHIALLRIGAVVVPVNGAYGEREVQHIARDCRPVAAINDHPRWDSVLASVCSVRRVGDVVSAASARSAAETEANSRFADVAARVELDTSEPADAALIGYTSGTTGAPKGAVLTHRNLLTSVAALQLAWRWSEADRLVLTLPLFHMHGLGVGLHGTLTVGASAVLLEGFDPAAIFDAIKAHKATMLFGVPTMYHRLAAHQRVGELAPLRLCVAGSAPLPAELHRALTDTAGQSVLERYGMTETVMLVSNPFDGERRAGSVGFPLPGVEVALLRDGAVIAYDAAGGDGEPGEIVVRGPNVFSGYWERDDANAASFVDGWFRTGDLATVAPDGYITIVGRAKELIISGGFNVYPARWKK